MRASSEWVRDQKERAASRESKARRQGERKAGSLARRGRREEEEEEGSRGVGSVFILRCRQRRRDRDPVDARELQQLPIPAFAPKRDQGSNGCSRRAGEQGEGSRP